MKPSNQFENASGAITRRERVDKRADQGHVGVEVDPGVRPDRLLGLGEDVAHGDRLAGPGLEDPRARDPQGRVLLVGRHDQGVERGIAEDLPPVLQVVVLHAGIVRLDPFRGHGRRRPAVVGPDLETVVNPLPGAGRDAAAIEQDRDHQAGQRGPSPTARSRNSVGIMPVWKSPGHPSFPSCVSVHGFPHENIALGKSRTIRTDGTIGRSGAAD